MTGSRPNLPSNPTKIQASSNPTKIQVAANSAKVQASSVPISVYRELAVELRQAQATIEALQVQNQQLAAQNQRLRSERERLLQASQRYTQEQTTTSDVVEARQQSRPESPSIETPRFVSAEGSASVPPTQVLQTEQEDSRHRYGRLSEGEGEIRGPILVVVIALVMAIAFGAGFFLVRPLLPRR